MKDKNIYFEEILVLVSNIWKFLENKNEEELMVDHKTCAAIVFELTIIGENVKKIEEHIRKKIDLPWRNIIGFRNKAVHEYGSIDRQIVVDVVFKQLPRMETEIKKFLKK